MNMLGTHDTERAITALAGDPSNGRGRDWQSGHRLSDSQREYGRQRCRLASAIQYTLPGIPSIYYGDEAGMEGYRDPFNRACYPWGDEDTEMVSWYRTLGQIRRSMDCFSGSEMDVVKACDRVMAYIRRGASSSMLIAVNAGQQEEALSVPDEFRSSRPLIGEYDGGNFLHVPAGGVVLLANTDIKK